MKYPLQQIFMACTLSMAASALLAPAVAQHVTTSTQKETAQRVAQAGVALDELSPNAPDQYTIKRGDTLWAISALYLKRPWRWPELWGMNLNEIRNPHLIYPGQVLYLDKSSGRAVLSARAGSLGDMQTVKVSPRTRSSSLPDAAIPTLPAHLLEPFLAEPALVDAEEFANAPRIVAGPDGRVVFARGDRIYARSANSIDLKTDANSPDAYRVYRNAVPLKDPNTGEILAYEAQYLGNVEMIRPENLRPVANQEGKSDKTDIIPATLDIITSKEEMRVGDRLQVAPKREFAAYVPRAPGVPIEGARIMSVYGSAVSNVGQNQVVSINRGSSNGLEVGHVLSIQSDGRLVTDRTGTDGKPVQIKLPDERNGLLMVFKTFDKVSYALILNITSAVRAGDHLINPR